MKEQTRYIERSGLKDGNHLEVSVFYDKGGKSYFTGQVSPRGYYLSVRPVTLNNGMVRFSMFSGCKKLILESNRFSEKQFANAIEKAKVFEDDLISNITMKEAV
jgi:hypothetical protein